MNNERLHMILKLILIKPLQFASVPTTKNLLWRGFRVFLILKRKTTCDEPIEKA
jgi:hypothetical protein